MSDPAPAEPDTKKRLFDAAEHLFAQNGIQGTRIREINELAGQRNPSALHYHFGSRTGLVEAILRRFQLDVDAQSAQRLDELAGTGRQITMSDIIDSVVQPLVRTLEDQSGRDCVRIIPQMLPALSRNLRQGKVDPITPHTLRIFELLDDRMVDLKIPEGLRRERLVAYGVVMTGLLAERAHHLESDDEALLDDRAFARHLVDVLVAFLTSAPGPEGT